MKASLFWNVICFSVDYMYRNLWFESDIRILCNDVICNFRLRVVYIYLIFKSKSNPIIYCFTLSICLRIREK
jgi:hypothetical protein